MNPVMWHVGAWLVLLVLAMGNGMVRGLTYGKYLGEASAKAFAVFPLLLAMGGLAVWLHQRHPLASAAQAWGVGLAWMLATVLFEFALGRLGPSHLPWPQLLAMYDVRTGSLWLLVVLALLLLPPLFHWLRQLP